MTFDNRFSATVPAPLEGALPVMPVPDALPDARRADYEAAGAMGSDLAAALAAVRKAVDTLLATRQLAGAQARPVTEALDTAARIAMQGRLLAKVASGSVRHTNEPVSLDQIVERLLAPRLVPLRQLGIHIERNIHPVTAVIDKDLATAMLDAALDWAQEPGQRMEVSLEVKAWPAHGLLRIKTSQAMPGNEPGWERGTAREQAGEKLSWLLVTEIARAVGATLDRVRSPGQTLLMIEFARTVRELEGLTAMEVELGIPTAVGSSSRVLAGHRALIVTSDVKLREEAKRVCSAMGLVVDNVPSSLLAVQRCESERPDVIVVDERFNDDRFAQLREKLAGQQGSFPLVEIAYGAGAAPAISGWGEGGITRVGRTDLAAQLPQALALEMSKTQ